MKKIIFVLILFFSIQTSYSQVWVDKGATWYYDWGNLSGGGFIKINYAADTLILGKNCQVITGMEYYFVMDQFGIIHFIGITPYSNNYTYRSGDTVFYFRNNQFYTLYNFGANPGDKWDVGADTINSFCSNSFVKVDSIGTTSLNGNLYRWISLSPDSNSAANLSGKAIERFGPTESYLFPVYLSCDTSIIVEYPYYHLTCFSDSSFSLNNAPNNDCEYLLHTGIKEYNSSNKIIIYPNPTTGVINFLNYDLNKYYIKVFNVTGQLLLEFDINSKSESKDISCLNKGFYFLECTNVKGDTFSQKIILN